MLNKSRLFGLCILNWAFIVFVFGLDASEIVIKQNVELPLYGASQRPAGDPFAYQELLNEIRLLRKAVEAQNPAKAGTPWEAMYTDRCFSCHARSNSNKGGGFVLLEDVGGMAQITPVQMLKVVYMTYEGRMPPGKRLNDTEFSQVIKHAAQEAQK